MSQDNAYIMANSKGSVCVPGFAGEGTGFNFDLCKRNELLLARGVKAPAPTKTGTTIAGIVFKVRMSACCEYDHGVSMRTSALPASMKPLKHV